MKRLFVLLLICLLPMQVFAGMLTSKTAIDVAALELQVQQQLQAEAVAAAHAQQSLPDEQSDSDDDGASYADSEDFSSHAGVGDETVLNPALAFVSDSATLAPALSSDAASKPPFLPPAGRPPRV